MHRFFGKKKAAPPVATLGETSERLGSRMEGVETKIKGYDAQLLEIKGKIKATKSASVRNGLKKRALNVLKQRKMYEKQRDQMMKQQFNVDQTAFATENVSTTIETVAAMKSAASELKVQMKAMDIDAIEDLQEDISDMLLDVDGIQDVMGQSYAMEDDLDEDELMAELDELEDELDMESQQVPDYLLNAASASKVDESQQQASAVPVDEFGLPITPARQLA
jgi:charged multivesicular body protein 5